MKSTIVNTALAAALAMGAATGASAQVVAGDGFSFNVLGTNPDLGRATTLFAPQTVPFGTTRLFDYRGGQTLTVTSAETRNGLQATDVFSFYVTDNFLPAGTQFADGTAITGIQVALGNGAGDNPVNLAAPIASIGGTGTLTYDGGSFSFPADVTASDDGLSYSLFANIYNGTDDQSVSPDQYRRYDFSITYLTAAAAVPEPATWAVMLVGLGLAGIGLRRRGSAVVRVAYR